MIKIKFKLTSDQNKLNELNKNLLNQFYKDNEKDLLLLNSLKLIGRYEFTDNILENLQQNYDSIKFFQIGEEIEGNLIIRKLYDISTSCDPYNAPILIFDRENKRGFWDSTFWNKYLEKESILKIEQIQKSTKEEILKSEESYELSF